MARFIHSQTIASMGTSEYLKLHAAESSRSPLGIQHDNAATTKPINIRLIRLTSSFGVASRYHYGPFRQHSESRHIFFSFFFFQISVPVQRDRTGRPWRLFCWRAQRPQKWAETRGMCVSAPGRWWKIRDGDPRKNRPHFHIVRSGPKEATGCHVIHLFDSGYTNKSQHLSVDKHKIIIGVFFFF